MGLLLSDLIVIPFKSIYKLQNRVKYKLIIYYMTDQQRIKMALVASFQR